MRHAAMYLLAIVVAVVTLSGMVAPVRASETDDRIESSARKSYVFKTYLKDDDIEVKSSDGIVTLTGTVSEKSHKSLAQETVASLPGVKSVDNKIEIKGEHPAENSNTWLEAKVKLVLLFHRNVSAIGTGVSVKDGVVTLRGKADSGAQKELTAEYVKDVEGVRDVKNEMVVSEKGNKEEETLGEKIDDASITAQVKMTLLFHRATSALATKVETNDGVVTLGGTARNAAERDLVSKLVSDIHGVKSVKNRMTVDASE